MIGNLLDMSRIQSGAVQPFARAVALEEVVPGALRGIAPDVAVHIDVPDGLPLLHTDPVLLERILANLLANAVRHSPRDRPPSVRGAELRDGEAVLVEVVDHGPGIPAAARERIFQPFQQLDDHHPSGGVGLGLAVARGLVEAIGGHIDAATTPGGGLTMRFDVPAVAAGHSVDAVAS